MAATWMAAGAQKTWTGGPGRALGATGQSTVVATRVGSVFGHCRPQQTARSTLGKKGGRPKDS
jgi:hypothetical protein